MNSLLRSGSLLTKTVLVNSRSFTCSSVKMLERETKGTYDYETIAVRSPAKHILNVELNRPESYNSMNKEFFREFLACFREIQNDTNCRAVTITAAGKFFTSGLDFNDMSDLAAHVTSEDDIARKAKFLQAMITSYQKAFTAIEKCSKPVIAAIHSGCVGAGIDLVSACDMRYCTTDSWFSIKEVDIGLAADLGTLQRLPKIVGNSSLARELIYTCRKMKSDEAKELGLVSRIYPTQVALQEGALEMAKLIATKSPVAVQGSKISLIHSRDRSVKEGLQFMTYWNMVMLQSEDILKAASAALSKAKEPPTFSKL